MVTKFITIKIINNDVKGEKMGLKKYSTLGHVYNNSLVSNAFGFLRQPIEFDPYNIKSDWVITGVPFDMATSSRPG